MKIALLVSLRDIEPSVALERLCALPLQSDAIALVQGAEQESHVIEHVDDHIVELVFATYIDEGKAHNDLLAYCDADVVAFHSLGEDLNPDYAALIERAFAHCPKAQSICFGEETEKKHLPYRKLMAFGLGNVAFRTQAVAERGISFLEGRIQESKEAIELAFLYDLNAWPNRTFLYSEHLVSSVPTALSARDQGFVSTYRFGVLWLASFYAIVKRRDAARFPSAKEYCREGFSGHRDALSRYLVGEEKPKSKENLFFVSIAIISLLGMASQGILSLRTVFAEIMYIPIWISLVFLTVFAVIYALVAPRLYRQRLVFWWGLGIGLLSTIACLVTLLFSGVNPYMSIYGALLEFVLVFGLVFCFLSIGTRTPTEKSQSAPDSER